MKCKDCFDNCLKSEEKFILPQKISGNINCENCIYSSACALGDIQACIIDKLVSEDLEKAARSYSNNLDNIYGSIGEQTRNAFKAGARWADEHPRKDLVEINKIYIWLSDFLDKCYIEDRGEAEEINADLILKSFLKVAKGE